MPHAYRRKQSRRQRINSPLSWASLLLSISMVEAFGLVSFRIYDSRNSAHVPKAPSDGTRGHDRGWIGKVKRDGIKSIWTSSQGEGFSPSMLPDRPLELWLDGRNGAIDPDSWQRFQALADTVVLDKDQEQLPGPVSNRRLVVTGDGKLEDGDGNIAGASVALVSPRDQQRAISLMGSVDWVQVTCSDWTMIPAENLVSVAGGTPTRIAVELSEPSQVQGAAFALQRGVDALLLRPNDDLWAEAVDARKKRREKAGPSGSSADLDSSASSSSSLSGGSRDHRDHDPQGTRVALSVGSVAGTKAVGVGDRVCVDLIQSLSNGEGMLVGSSAKLLALVHAETFDTGFVPARPFRVNAGPVHAYALMANGSTKYLSELRAGDQVLVVNYRGESRSVVIGRLKVEVRPMIMVELQGESGSKGQLFLQQAETVRLMSPVDIDYDDVGNAGADAGAGETEIYENWRPLAVTDLEGGEPLFLLETSRGTHIGRPIDAVVNES